MAKMTHYFIVWQARLQRSIYGFCNLSRINVRQHNTINPGLNPTNACSRVCGREWLGCHAGHQEVSKCCTRMNIREYINNMFRPSINKAAHSGFETQKPKIGVPELPRPPPNVRKNKNAITMVTLRESLRNSFISNKMDDFRNLSLGSLNGIKST